MSFIYDSSLDPWHTNRVFYDNLHRSLVDSIAVTGLTNALNTGALDGINQLANNFNLALRSGIGGLSRVLEDIKISNNNLIDYLDDLNKRLGIVNEGTFSYEGTPDFLKGGISSFYESSTSEEKVEIDSFVKTTTQAIGATQSPDGIIIFLDKVKEIIIGLSNNEKLSVFIKGRLIALLDGMIMLLVSMVLISKKPAEPQITQYETKIIEVQQEINDAVYEILPVVTATTAVQLRGKPNKKSRSLFIIQEGQEVKVIEEKFKWINVLVRGEDGCFIEGWTYKEYYE